MRNENSFSFATTTESPGTMIGNANGKRDEGITTLLISADFHPVSERDLQLLFFQFFL